MRIVVSGSIAFDYLMEFPGKFREHFIDNALDRVSLSFLVESLVRERGGSGANIAFNLALLGERPILMGTAGHDFPAYRQWLDDHGVDTSAVRDINEVFSASFFVNTDSENNQIGSFYTGAMAYSKGYTLAEAVDPLPDLIINSPSDPKAMLELAEETRQLGVTHFFDPSQQVIWLDGDDLRYGIARCDMLIVNEYEWEMVANKTGLQRDQFLSEGKKLIVTHSGKGSHIYADGEHYTVPVFPVENIVDPTGVGDAYRAGLLKGLASGFGWKLCGQIGGVAAAYCLEQKGTQNHAYTVAEFVARFRTTFDDQGALDAWL
ncbi:MAG: carbohydrate kinase family protein [Anaerolineae bacterium]|nr:carbohydrate kinase family protein [Anaerolineae bacterium]